VRICSDAMGGEMLRRGKVHEARAGATEKRRFVYTSARFEIINAVPRARELLSGCFAAIAYVTKVIGEIAIVTYHANSPMLAGEFRHALWRGCPGHFLSTKLFAVLM
jgi:hypothetical protein